MTKDTRSTYAAKVKAMHKRILLDLAAKALSDGEIEGIEQDTHVDRGAVTGWTFRVNMATGRALVYTLANQEGAPILCDGNPLAEVGEA